MARDNSEQSRISYTVQVLFSASRGCGQISVRREARNSLRAITSCRPSSLISENFDVANAFASYQCAHRSGNNTPRYTATTICKWTDERHNSVWRPDSSVGLTSVSVMNNRRLNGQKRDLREGVNS